MPAYTTSSNDGDTPHASSPGRPAQHPPLVIVSERGRHSQASRRIVRAQAARASAAQSRETRARNREDRHPHSPSEGSASRQQRRVLHPSRTPSSHQGDQRDLVQPPPQKTVQHSRSDESSYTAKALDPLVNWVTNMLQLSAASLAAAAAALASNKESPPTYASADAAPAAMEDVHVPGGLFSGKRLPVALPRGFAALQKRVQISGPFLHLLSRSACFDYDSPGVSNRLNQLLFDIIMTSATSTLVSGSQPTHPIQEHLRIASVCLAIWSGQRTEGAAFDQRYMSGLEAAWQEAMVLNMDALRDDKSAEAALWALFMISVTCQSAVNLFSQMIVDLLRDLRLQHWGDVRSVLISFIYPGGNMDGPCKQFYDQLLVGQLPIG